MAKNSKHRDSAVFVLYDSESIEPCLISIIEKTKRIPETKRRLGTKLGLERHLQGRRSGNLGDRSEGGGADKGGNGKDGSEHYCLVYFKLLVRVN